jgi:hemerythrin-like domain-containing protein
VIRYFDTAARDHHSDEEDDLFPALLESMAGSDALCIQALTDGLRAEHRVLETIWQKLRKPLTQIAAGHAAALAVAEVQAFVEAYSAHIDKEETELLPLATRLLSDLDISLLGSAMRLRRGIA